MNGVRAGWLAAAVLLAPTLPASALTAAGLAELQGCQAQGDAQARLACYDAAMLRIAGPVAARNVVVAPPLTPPAAASTGAPPAADAGFGLPEGPRPAAQQFIESRVAGRFEGWAPGTRLTLVNGQVWEVVDGTRASYDLGSPAVRIRRGMLGSFFAEIEGVGATPRVRRVR